MALSLKFLLRKFAILGLIGGIGAAPHAYAQDRLTEASITAFIEETSLLTSGLDGSEAEAIEAYLEKHLDPKSHFRSKITFNIPGFPPQEQSLSLSKREFIEATTQGTQSLENYSNEISVDKVRVSRDGTKATVQTSGVELGLMEVPAPEGGTQEVPIEGQSKCSQIIKLSKKGVIQMFNATCTTTINFQDNL